MGFGLNARGAMELVIASIGLSIGVLNDATYAMVVLIAVFTTVMAAPTVEVLRCPGGTTVARVTGAAPRAPDPHRGSAVSNDRSARDCRAPPADRRRDGLEVASNSGSSD